MFFAVRLTNYEIYYNAVAFALTEDSEFPRGTETPRIRTTPTKKRVNEKIHPPQRDGRWTLSLTPGEHSGERSSILGTRAIQLCAFGANEDGKVGCVVDEVEPTPTVTFVQRLRVHLFTAFKDEASYRGGQSPDTGHLALEAQ